MLAFIDESGDTGFKFDKGSSERFVVTVVLFTDPNDAMAAEERIRDLRQELGVKKDFEFHYAHTKAVIRDRFFEVFSAQQFEFSSVSINKRLVTDPELYHKGSFYKHACKLVLESIRENLRDTKVVIDGSGGREFRRQLGTYLRRNANSADEGFKRIKKVQLEDSKKNDLIQLADMVCGAVSRDLAGRLEGTRHLRHIRNQKLWFQEWPKK